MIRYLDGLGYTMYWHSPRLFNPQNFFGNPENVFGGLISQNMVCLHRDQPQKMEGFKRVAEPAADAPTG